jgi:hypothetical protein
LQQAGTTHVYLARPAEARGEPRHVIRHLVRPDAWDAEQYRRACDDFLLSVSTQQQAARSSRWWAPIHKVNESAPAAVSDYYEKSVEWLISRRVALGHRDVYRIVSGVLTGLKAIENACSRPHGNLKPSNVLISGKGRIAGSRLALCDPAPSRALLPDPSNPHASRAADLHHLGQMLYELVTHDPFNEIDDYPVAPDRFDKDLGRQGKRWAAVCNELLRPDADATPQRIKQVHAMVRRLKPLRSKLAVPALVLLIAGLGAGGVLASNWREWFDNRVQADVRDSDPRQPPPHVTHRPATTPSDADLTASNAVEPDRTQSGQASHPQVSATLPHVTQTHGTHQQPPRQDFTIPDPRPLWPGRQSLTATRQAVSALQQEFGPQSAAEFTAALASIEERLTRIEKQKWTAASQRGVEDELTEMTNVLRVLQHSAQGALAHQREHATWQAAIRRRDSVSRTPLLDQEWVRRRDEILKDKAGSAAQREVIESLAAVLARLDTDFPAGDPPATPDRSWGEVLGDAPSARREQALRELLRAIEIRDGEATLPAPRIAAARDALEQWKLQTAAVMADHAAIESSLAALLPLDTPQRQGGGSARQRYAAWDGKLAGIEPEAVSRRVSAIRSRVAAVLAIEKTQDPATLLALAAGKDGAAPEVMLAAWRRLSAQTDIATTLLPQVHDARQKLLRALQSAPDPARRQAVLAEVNAGATALWRQAYARAATPQAIDQTLALMASFGISADSITDDRLRYNLLLHSLKQRASKAADDASAAKLAQQAATELASLKLRQAGALADVLRTASLSDSAPTDTAITPGPAEPIWTRQGIENGGLRFVRDDGAGGSITIDFTRVNPPAASGVAPFYLSTTEVSLGLFAHTVNSKGQWQMLASLIAARLEREARGPRVWRWADADRFSGLLHAHQWVELEALRRRGEAPELAEAPALRRTLVLPSGEMPMQQVTAPAAAYVASLLGCRLPTSAEWKAAYAASGESADQAASTGAWNLRDLTWTVQHRHAAQRIAERARFAFPDEGAFGVEAAKAGAYAQVWNRGLKTGRPTAAPDAELYSDGLLWFRAVADGGQGPFRNLVGNVAEFVIDDPAVWKDLAAPGGWKSAGKLIARAKVMVIGGSALSPPELRWDQPVAQPPEEASRKYADVGFRLALPAPASREPVLAKLRKTVDAQAYLTP